MSRAAIKIQTTSMPDPHCDMDRPIASALAINLTPVDRLVSKTALAALGEFRCPPGHTQFQGGGPQLCHYMVFPRNPVRIHVRGGDCELASPGTLRFYNVDDSYDRASVGGQPDESDWIALSTEVLERLMLRSWGSVSAFPSILFPARSAPVSARLCLQQRQLFHAAREQRIYGLCLEEAVIEFAARIIEEAGKFWCQTNRPRRRPRPISQRRRCQIVEQVRAMLALDLAHELSLQELAGRVHCSAAHLSRLFLAHTGRSLHAFRQQIRLHHAFKLMTSGGWSLADIAVEVGYASHSHMTQAFKRDFGVVPSRLLREYPVMLKSGPGFQ
jgi:AraC-like DNA-binding protein